jgi:hypothetical protein
VPTKNSRNVRVLINGTAVNKTHGATVSPTTDYSEDTSHGDEYKSYLPGLKDFMVDISAWYDSAYHTLRNAALDNTALSNVLVYPDYSQTTHYWHCPTMYASLNEWNGDIGNTIGETFQLRNAGGSTPNWVYS